MHNNFFTSAVLSSIKLPSSPFASDTSCFVLLYAATCHTRVYCVLSKHTIRRASRAFQQYVISQRGYEVFSSSFLLCDKLTCPCCYRTQRNFFFFANPLYAFYDNVYNSNFYTTVKNFTFQTLSAPVPFPPLRGEVAASKVMA
jgi:hypothetical protein